MDLVCPECYGALELVDGVTARCTCEGRRYRILFVRQPAAPAPPPPPPAAPTPPAESVIVCPHCQKQLRLSSAHLGKRVRCPACHGEFDAPGAGGPEAAPTCRRHPNRPADRTCATCHAPICPTCSFPQPDGTSLCPDCVSRPRAAAAPPAPPPLPGLMCARHPNVAAVRRCKVCNAGVCATCDFELPGGVHVCPTCVSAPSRKMSRKRKANLAWSYVLGVWSLVGTIVLLSGALAGSVRSREELEMVGRVVGFLVFAPAIIGTALGFAALDRRLGNPPVVWVAVIGNSVVLAALVLLEIIGAMM